MAPRSAQLTLLLLCAAWLAGCGEMRPAGSGHYYLRYPVKPGETLYSIAWRFGHDYREVAAWNRIGPPYRIHPGQELLIMTPDRYTLRERGPIPPAAASSPGPIAAAPASAPSPAKAAAASAPSGATPARPPIPAAPTKAPVSRSPAPSGPIKWIWPTTGKTVAGFAAGQRRKGIDVSGQLGQPVRAAADGDVVYSGNGLIGYGNLVIVKHDDVYLSAYGHNRRLLVKEGDKVKQGATLGEMGEGPKGLPVLHFEIRKNGKPMDPLLYLPDKPT
ncbi:MAG: peptidoglycan DD-metalloendopeptidase family protein [Gammaproteobacteria bacterium]|nr:peptidoglycan DD-metalloendopeptidase family protein [Gammaproteobacteria bacterium]